MRNLLIAMIVFACSCSHKMSDNFVLIKGGPFKDTNSNFYGRNVIVESFYIGKYEVTQKEWVEIMGSNPSQFKGDILPVESVSWYDCVEYCNERSKKESLRPYYNIDRNKKDPNNTNEIDNIKWTVTINVDADGYRLPTEVEWEYAASGGQMSRNYLYSGGDKANDVAWYWQNAGDQYLTGAWSWPAIVKNNNRTKPVGKKAPNELGLYDMSGNVREWCWNVYQPADNGEAQGRVWKGGGWIGADFCCTPSFRAGHEANGKGPDQGFRVCLSGM